MKNTLFGRLMLLVLMAVFCSATIIFDTTATCTGGDSDILDTTNLVIEIDDIPDEVETSAEVYNSVINQGQGNITSAEVYNPVINQGQGNITSAEVYNPVINQGQGNSTSAEVYNSVIDQGQGNSTSAEVSNSVINQDQESRRVVFFEAIDFDERVNFLAEHTEGLITPQNVPDILIDQGQGNSTSAEVSNSVIDQGQGNSTSSEVSNSVINQGQGNSTSAEVSNSVINQSQEGYSASHPRFNTFLNRYQAPAEVFKFYIDQIKKKLKKHLV